MDKLSEKLKRDHEGGDFGNALDGCWQQAKALEDENERLKAENEKLKATNSKLNVLISNLFESLKAENKELKQQVPPIENGTNRYGLDVSYFRNLINRELNRGLSDFKPHELARVFARMSKAADSDVLKEREFCTD